MTACATYTAPLRAALRDGLRDVHGAQGAARHSTVEAPPEQPGPSARARQRTGVWVHVGLIPGQQLPFPAGFVNEPKYTTSEE